MNNKEEKIEEAIKQLAAKFLQLESNRISLITVTSVHVFQKRTQATVYITVLPEHKQDEALDFANRKRTEFKEYLKKHARMQKLPRVHFAIDLGEKNRQRIDEISNKVSGGEDIIGENIT